jgi:hypothetical protein
MIGSAAHPSKRALRALLRVRQIAEKPHPEGLCKENLILRSRLKGGVSKDESQSWCSPPFETRPAGAPQGEVCGAITL